jgi:3-phenylpropionate/trans-cinnamate dioxygenase ferredoxin reductase component
MLGGSVAYDRLPYFFSDQYDVGMEYSGYARGCDRVVLRGDPAAREFVAFWMFEDRVMAGMNVNVWDVIEPIKRLIGERIAVEDRQLADIDLPLDQLTSAIGGRAA